MSAAETKKTAAEIEEIDCQQNDYPVCPHCGTTDVDWWDGQPDRKDGDTWTVECPGCDKEYAVTLTVTTTFDTKKIEPTEPEAKT